jgi:regulatory protein YycI of two-component signal transduction system YycFG
MEIMEIVMWMVIMAVALGVYYFKKKEKKRHSWLKENGEAVRAEVVAVLNDRTIETEMSSGRRKMGSGLRKKHYLYYYIKCAVKDPKTNRITATYDSQRVRRKNLDQYKGWAVTIYLHPSKPDELYVDFDSFSPPDANGNIATNSKSPACPNYDNKRGADSFGRPKESFTEAVKNGESPAGAAVCFIGSLICVFAGLGFLIIWGHLAGFIIIGISGILIIFGIVLLYFYFKRKKLNKWLILHGEAVQTEIIAVEIDKNTTINGQYPYSYFICAVKNPTTNEITKTYNSCNIKNKRQDHPDLYTCIGNEITVYIHPDNPDKYYVDVEMFL